MHHRPPPNYIVGCEGPGDSPAPAAHLPHTGLKAMLEDDQYLPARKRVALNYI